MDGDDDGDRVAVCVIRFRPHDDVVMMTVTTAPDIERPGQESSFTTVHLDDVFEAVRELARALLTPE